MPEALSYTNGRTYMRQIGVTFVLCFALLCSYGHAFEGNSRLDMVGENIETFGIDPKKEPTVYIFAQPDCASCSLQLNLLSSLQNQDKTLNVVFVTEQKSSLLFEYLAGFNLRAEVIDDIEGKIVSRTKLTVIPTTVFVNKAGVIEGFYEGMLERREVQQLGEALVQGVPLPLISTPGGVGSIAPKIKNVNWTESKHNLIVFHSSVCQFCNEELPYLTEFASGHSTMSIIVVAVDSERAVAKQFVEANAPTNVRIVSDANGLSGVGLYESYLAEGTPTHVLVNGKGRIIWRSSGFNASTANPFKELTAYMK